MSTEPSPREVDIAFSTPMILAIEAGRKSVTRRIIKQPPPNAVNVIESAEPGWVNFVTTNLQPVQAVKLRYKVGDVLRVREAAWVWCEKVPDGLTKTKRPKFRYVPELSSAYKTFYAADGDGIHKPVDRFLSFVPAQRFGYRLKIPRYLPGWAVRTRLRVISVRVERLQAITEEDAKREGVNVGERGHIVGSTPDQIGRLPCTHCGKKRIAHVGSTHACWGGMGTTWNPTTYRGGFSYLWESINGPGSWDANPWVARIEFERL